MFPNIKEFQSSFVVLFYDTKNMICFIPKLHRTALAISNFPRVRTARDILKTCGLKPFQDLIPKRFDKQNTPEETELQNLKQ